MTAAIASKPQRQIACARCGAVFACSQSADCWCAAEAYRLPMTKAWLEDCLCPDCLRKAAALLTQSHRAADEDR